jgi:hypothetical protein
VNGLLWVYLLGGILEIVGILYTGAIGVKVVRRGSIATGLSYPKPWAVWVALGLVLSGVVLVVGNVASLYVK